MATSYQHWQWVEDDEGILWLGLDKADASTNTLSREVLEELDAILAEVKGDLPLGLVLHSNKSSGFIAGADVKIFTTLKDPREALELINKGQGIMSKVAELKCPTVALIHGFCLGGGLELALACDYRIAEDAPGTRLGLPEVRLGIHPGFGGSVRLPPLVGPLAAMDMMLTGRSMDSRRAKRMGLVDHALPERHLRSAARRMIVDNPKSRRVSGLKKLPSQAWLRPLVARLLRHQVAKRASEDHYPAPFALINLWEAHAGDPRAMMREEARSVAELITGDTAQNLIRVFFLQERLKGEGDKKAFSPQHVHVIGGGVMGGDIAIWSALQGFHVTIQDRNDETLARVIKRAHALYKKRLKQPRLIQAALDRLIPDKHGLGIPRADVVIEAIFENLEIKQALFRELEPKLKPGAVLATNTSSIPLEELGEALEHPERLVGLHFFNPVAKMQLVEVVHGQNTSAEVLRKATAFTRHIDRLPLPVKSSPGFLVNRVLMPYLIEAVILEGEGVAAADIDQAALDFGMPMGPIHLADTVGLDICLSVAEILSQHLDLEVPPRLLELVTQGNLGVKSGKGFYQYKKGKPVRHKHKNSEDMTTDMANRMILRLINEAIACLREGVISDPELLDAGVIFGTGFAPFRGGPLHYLSTAGNDVLRQRLKGLEQRFGHRFSADAGWTDTATHIQE